MGWFEPDNDVGRLIMLPTAVPPVVYSLRKAANEELVNVVPLPSAPTWLITKFPGVKAENRAVGAGALMLAR